MSSGMIKTTVREIRGSLGRYIAIFAIVMLGVGLFAGLKATTPAMIETENQYLSEQNFFDLRLLSSIGFEDTDIEKLKQLKETADVEGAVSADALCDSGDGNESVYKFHTVPDAVSRVVVTAGRLPQRADECVLDASLYGEEAIGSKIRVTDNNSADTLDMFAERTFTAVGIVRSPYYINFERGTSSIGDGKITAFLYVPKDAFACDYLTEIYVTAKQKYDVYTDAYEDYIDSILDGMETQTETLVQARYQKLTQEAQEKIDDAQKELDEKKAEAEEELRDGRKKIADGEKELKDGEQELLDGAKKISDGEKECADAESEIASREKELADGEKELRSRKSQLFDAEVKIKQAEQEIADNETKLADGRAKLRQAEKQLKTQEAKLKQEETQLLKKEKALPGQEAELKEQLTALNKKIKEADSQEKALSEQLAKLKSREAELERQEAELLAQKEQLEQAYAGLNLQQKLSGQEASLQKNMKPGQGTMEQRNADSGQEAMGQQSVNTDRGAMEQQNADSDQGAFRQQSAKSDQGTEGQQNTDSDQGVLRQQRAELPQEEQGPEDTGRSLAESQAGDYEERMAAIQEGLSQIAAGKKELADGISQVQAGLAQLADGRKQAESGRKQLQAGLAELAEGKKQLKAGKKKIESAKMQLADGKKELAGQETQLLKSERELEAGKSKTAQARAELADGRTQLARAEAELADGRTKLADGRTELQKAKAELADAQKELKKGKADLKKGRRELADAKTEYTDAVEKFEKETADAQRKIDDARAELSELEEPDSYVLTRNTNIGYACYESDSNIVAAIANVFPVFFFLVAALVCMTTMNRMIEEQRTQIGVLKALGYSDGAIMGKYLFYAGSAAFLGAVAGCLGGTWLFPKVIWMGYSIMYSMGDITYIFDVRLALLSLAAALLCSVGAAYASCRYELYSVPANLIRPKAPKSGRRIFLERVSFIWSRMKFLHKVSMRNIVRYKKRFFMMILGIGGCTALLVTGFGIQDSVTNVADMQYNEIQVYDIGITFADGVSNKDMEALKKRLDKKISRISCRYEESVDLDFNGKTKSIYLEIPENAREISDFLNLHTKDGKEIAYPSEGEAVLSAKIADNLGIHTGDTLTLRDSDMNSLSVTVTELCENYVYNYIYISRETYKKQLGSEPEFKSAYVTVKKGEDIHETAAAVSDSGNVLAVSITGDMRERIASMMESMDYIVMLIIVCAGSLAFIVLYNLTNINITERIREIATIKVLGFYAKETADYVFRENLALTAIGAVIGLGLGKWLHAFVMYQVNIDMLSFKTMIRTESYLWSLLLTFCFAMLVNGVMFFKLEKINMAESLKSIE